MNRYKIIQVISNFGVSNEGEHLDVYKLGEDNIIRIIRDNNIVIVEYDDGRFKELINWCDISYEPSGYDKKEIKEPLLNIETILSDNKMFRKFHDLCREHKVDGYSHSRYERNFTTENLVIESNLIRVKLLNSNKWVNVFVRDKWIHEGPWQKDVIDIIGTALNEINNKITKSKDELSKSILETSDKWITPNK